MTSTKTKKSKKKSRLKHSNFFFSSISLMYFFLRYVYFLPFSFFFHLLRHVYALFFISMKPLGR